MAVYPVRSVEVMGDLYEQLVRPLGVRKEKKLIDYKPHRFMSLTRVFQRIIKHWNVLCLWYEERANKAIRGRSPTPSPFPLSDSHLLMKQLLSLMLPISALNVKSLAEKANQVGVLFSAYKVMVTTIGPEASLRKHDATHDNPTSYHHSTLLPFVTKTRSLLSNAFHSRFFSRYTDREGMPESIGCEDDGEAKAAIYHERLNTTKGSELHSYRPPQYSATYNSGAFSEDLSELFDFPTMTPEPMAPRLLHEEVIDDELEHWFRDLSLLQPTAEGPERELHFWKRQQESGNYRYLSSVARIIFAVPASSAQIKRDFGISGQMVIVQRTSLSQENIDMCAFLNRNREFIDLTQCPKLSAAETQGAIPSDVQANLEPQTSMEMFESGWERALINSFSADVSTEL
ncbi:unnamed protein product [Phytophthora fragariaefolia]|uniref:Unnamed protein product n=1 Tax=Phytophthora fragariaefolia TaxID=1490495 RepID=A0A9W6XWI9_9STRA|nr:unnamed protein product [Phytophthora fragariaefolia]